MISPTFQYLLEFCVRLPNNLIWQADVFDFKKKSEREEKSKQIGIGIKCNWSELTGDL